MNKLIECKNCNKKIDYLAQSESGMGYIKCPECKVFIDQTGKVLSANVVLGKSMVDWTLNSTTTFLEANNMDEEIKKVVESMGFKYPDRDLAYFKTIYAELEVPNRNRMRLPSDAVKKGLDTFNGKQINFDHKGRNFICGFLLQAKIEKNFVISYGALFKGAFREEFDVIESLFKDKKLFVSFEIHRTDTEGNDVLKALSDGTYEITQVTCSGCGLLLSSKPACPKARVLDLLASAEVIEAEKIVDKIFRNSELSSKIMYAEQYMEEQNCMKCNPCKCIKEETKIMKPEDNLNISDNVPVISSSTESVTATAPVIEPAPAVIPTPVAAAVPAAELTPVVESTVVPPVVADVPAAVVERKLTQTITEETTTITDTYIDGGNKQERKGNRKTTNKYSDNTESVSTTEYDIVDSYTYAQLEAKVNEALAAQQEEVFAAAPKEVVDCIKGKTKGGMKMGEAMKTCWSDYKDKQAKAMADVAGAKDVEITTLKTENATIKIENEAIKAEVETLKAKKVEPPKMKASVKGSEAEPDNSITIVANTYRDNLLEKQRGTETR